MFVVECCVVRNDFRIKTTFGASLLRVVCRGARVLYVLFALLHTTSALTARCSCIRDKNCLPFASTWVYPRFFGGVRVAYLLGFLCCVFFVCLFFEKLLDTVTMRRKIEIAELVVSYIYILSILVLITHLWNRTNSIAKSFKVVRRPGQFFSDKNKPFKKQWSLSKLNLIGANFCLCSE